MQVTLAERRIVCREEKSEKLVSYRVHACPL